MYCQNLQALEQTSIAKPPQQKRKAKRKPRRRDDFLWKAIIEDIAEDFLRFFFPDADVLFDLDKKCEYLDKEFAPFFPQEEIGSAGTRYVDKLIKVYLKDGGEKWISVHLEVQNQRGKGDFSARMLRYWYNPNPFSVVILAALSAIKQKKITDLGLKAMKHELIRELAKRNMDSAKRKGIINFIKYYMNFENPKMMSTFDKELEILTGRTTPMGTEEYLLDRFKQEGRHEEAVEIALAMKKDKFPVEQIAKLTKLSIEEIKALQS